MNRLVITTITILVGLLLIGCSKKYSDNSDSYKLPPELAKCKIFHLSSGDLTDSITVTYCPHADTTTSYSESCGKNCVKDVNTTILSE